jgi:hypothetical protein
MKKIMADIETTFGSVKSPKWSLVARRQNDPRFPLLVDELRKSFVVRNYTDLNYSSEIDLLLTHEGRQWSLELSLVGDYALLRRSEEGTRLFLDGPKNDGDENIFRAVANIKPCQFLDRSILKEKIPFNFTFEGDRTEMVAVYKVLFAEEGSI